MPPLPFSVDGENQAPVPVSTLAVMGTKSAKGSGTKSAKGSGAEVAVNTNAAGVRSNNTEVVVGTNGEVAEGSDANVTEGTDIERAEGGDTEAASSPDHVPNIVHVSEETLNRSIALQAMAQDKRAVAIISAGKQDPANNSTGIRDGEAHATSTVALLSDAPCVPISPTPCVLSVADPSTSVGASRPLCQTSTPPRDINILSVSPPQQRVLKEDPLVAPAARIPALDLAVRPSKELFDMVELFESETLATEEVTSQLQQQSTITTPKLKKVPSWKKVIDAVLPRRTSNCGIGRPNCRPSYHALVPASHLPSQPHATEQVSLSLNGSSSKDDPLAIGKALQLAISLNQKLVDNGSIDAIKQSMKLTELGFHDLECPNVSFRVGLMVNETCYALQLHGMLKEAEELRVARRGALRESEVTSANESSMEIKGRSQPRTFHPPTLPGSQTQRPFLPFHPPSMSDSQLLRQQPFTTGLRVNRPLVQKLMSLPTLRLMSPPTLPGSQTQRQQSDHHTMLRQQSNSWIQAPLGSRQLRANAMDAASKAVNLVSPLVAIDNPIDHVDTSGYMEFDPIPECSQALPRQVLPLPPLDMLLKSKPTNPIFASNIRSLQFSPRRRRLTPASNSCRTHTPQRKPPSPPIRDFPTRHRFYGSRIHAPFPPSQDNAQYKLVYSQRPRRASEVHVNTPPPSSSGVVKHRLRRMTY